VSEPTGSVEVVVVTVPDERVPVPIGVPPLENVTVPVAPVGSVAVIATGWPNVLVDGFAVTVIVGVAFETVSVVDPVAALSLLSPL